MKQILKYNNRRLFVLLLFCLLLVSCATSYKLPTEYQSVSSTRATISNPYIRVGQEYLYRATITAYGHTFSGLLATKVTADNAWRVALTTDFGNTLFDFQNENGKIKVNYATPDLNRGIIIRTLTADFEKLLKTNFTVVKTYTDGTTQVQACYDGKDMIYLFTPKGKLQKQVNTQGKKLYTTFVYTPENTTITHHTLRIEIVLNTL